MLKQINWKQPKYMLPAIIFLPLVFIGYQACSLFSTDIEKEDQTVMTEGVNTALPEINQDKTGIKNKYDAMLEGFGRVKDYTGVENVERTEECTSLETDLMYSDEERRRIDSLNMVNQMRAEELREKLELEREEMRRRQERQVAGSVSTGSVSTGNYNQRAEDAEMRRLQEQMRLIQQMANGEQIMTDEEKLAEQKRLLAEAEKKRIQDSIALAQAPLAVNKRGAAGEEYFNTVVDNEDNPNLIKARVDELVKVKDGSRLRLRLSEDVEIDGHILKKGSYLYASVTGFSAQRVKAEVKSVLLGGSIKKIQLKVYDLDCMEGFYVPTSSFRDLTQQVGAQAIGGVNINTNTNGDQSVESVALQALQQAFSSTTSAVSRHIRQNQAKIKYNTEIYLVDESVRN